VSGYDKSVKHELLLYLLKNFLLKHNVAFLSKRFGEEQTCYKLFCQDRAYQNERFLFNVEEAVAGEEGRILQGIILTLLPFPRSNPPSRQISKIRFPTSTFQITCCDVVRLI
jgi:hypothetical protein